MNDLKKYTPYGFIALVIIIGIVVGIMLIQTTYDVKTIEINGKDLTKGELVVWLDKRATLLDGYAAECRRMAKIMRR